MALQLPLALDEPATLRRSLWILSAAPERLPQLRQAVSGRSPSIIHAEDGRQPMLESDAVLIRTGEHRYEAYRGAADLFAAAPDLDAELSSFIIDAVVGADDRAFDLIALCRGAGRRLTDDWGPISDVERLLRALRHPDFKAAPEERLRLCLFALGQFGSDRALLQAVVAAQAHRLCSMLGRPEEEAVGQRQFALLERTSLAGFAWPAQRSVLGQPDLFGPDPPGPARTHDLSIAAIPVTGLRLDLAPAAAHRGAAFTTERPEVRIDDNRLATVFGDVRSRRIVAETTLTSAPRRPRSIDVVVDWEIRQTMRPLLPPRQGEAIVHVWLESQAGIRTTVAKRTRIGESVGFEVRPELITTGGAIQGVVVFNSNLGVGARRRFSLGMAA